MFKVRDGHKGDYSYYRRMLLVPIVVKTLDSWK